MDPTKSPSELNSPVRQKERGLAALMPWATEHPWAYKFLGVALATLAALGLGVWTPQAFQGFDEKSDALTWNLSRTAQAERRVVIVDIDEKSVQALGAWPWSRSTMAQLVNSLNDYGVGLKLFDVVMPDAKDGDDQLLRSLKSFPFDWWTNFLHRSRHSSAWWCVGGCGCLRPCGSVHGGVPLRRFYSKCFWLYWQCPRSFASLSQRWTFNARD